MADAELLKLPDTWTQTCYACTNASFGDRGTYCHVFNEMIISEKLAGRDCGEFESNDGKTYVKVED